MKLVVLSDYRYRPFDRQTPQTSNFPTFTG